MTLTFLIGKRVRIVLAGGRTRTGYVMAGSTSKLLLLRTRFGATHRIAAGSIVDAEVVK